MVAGALRAAVRHDDRLVVVLIPDGGRNYLSKIFNDEWMRTKGFRGGAVKFETKAIHSGQDPEPTTGAVVVPIFATSTYAQDAPGKHAGYDYSRTDNPARSALQTALAALEEWTRGVGAAPPLPRQAWRRPRCWATRSRRANTSCFPTMPTAAPTAFS